MEKRNERPLSPHLTIYKPQITSVLSIMHRMTGVFLFLGLNFLFWVLSLILLQNMGLAMLDVNLLALLDNIVFKLFMLATTFSLYYHLANGVRHLFWDMGKGFTLGVVSASGLGVIIFALLLTVFTVYFGFFYQYQ